MAKKKRKRISAKVSKDRHSRGSIPTLNLPDGVVPLRIDKAGLKRFRFLAYVTGENNPDAGAGNEYHTRSYYKHGGIGPSNRSVVCLRSFGKPCPICEYQRELRTQADPDDQEMRDLIYSLRAQERQLYLLKDLKSEDPNQLMLWDVSYKGFGEQLDAVIAMGDEDDDREFFAMHDDGRIVVVSFAEKTIGASGKWFPAETIEMKAADPLESEADEMPCLDEMLVEKSYEELKAMLHGATAEPAAAPVKEEEEEEKEVPFDTESKSEAKVSVPQDDDDDDDDEW